MGETMTVTARAKINLALHVVGRRDDGYHLIESLAVFARDGDTLSAAPALEDDIVVAGHFAALVPIDGANLVARARDLMRDYFGEAAAQPVALRLEKHLPVASGIGGGSSDAAATMRLLARVWQLEAGDDELAQIGLRLGADVPMCLAARPLVARGVGEEIEVLECFPELPMVLVNPGVALATADVFAELASAANDPMPGLSACPDAASIADWLADTRNDLEPPATALLPDIRDTLAALRSVGARIARMSGSGATCYGLFSTAEQAGNAAAAIASAQPAWFVTATTSESAEHDHGPS